MTHGCARVVQFDRYGGSDVLYVAATPIPEPGPGEVLVAVRAAGINPIEGKVRSGEMHDFYPATFPSGQGSDLAGVITVVGLEAGDFTVGDEVLGWSSSAPSHATHVVVPVGQLIRKPLQLSWEVAGALYLVGTAAYAAVQAVDPQPGETVAVSASAGGVGSLAVQLLARRGVKVVGIASAANVEWLKAHGAIPVAYGDGLRERLIDAAGTGGVDAFIDLFGPEYLDLAVDLGVPLDRIVTIASFSRSMEIGARWVFSTAAATPEILAELASLVANGDLTVPVTASYPLDRVRDAFAKLEQGHTRGKIVLVP